jgi:hypothetical protein
MTTVAKAENEQAAPLVVTDETYAAIDPKALKLLARVAEKYRKLFFYSSVVEIRFGSEKRQASTRFRVALAENRGTISKVENDDVRRWVSDGKRTLATAKSKPKQYVLQPLNVDGFWRIQREEMWQRAGWQGVLTELLAGKFGALLLLPELERMTVEATNQNGATQKIVVFVRSDEYRSSGEMQLFIADDLTLRSVSVREKLPDIETFWEERYSEISLENRNPAAFYSSLSTVPPAGFQRVESFDEPMQTTPPVNNEIPRKTGKTNKLKTTK